MPTQKSKLKRSRYQRRKRMPAARTLPVAISPRVPVGLVRKPVTAAVTEKTYITTEPEVEIRKPATLAQALTEPAVAVVKPKTKIRKETVARTRRPA